MSEPKQRLGRSSEKYLGLIGFEWVFLEGAWEKSYGVLWVTAFVVEEENLVVSNWPLNERRKSVSLLEKTSVGTSLLPHANGMSVKQEFWVNLADLWVWLGTVVRSGILAQAKSNLQSVSFTVWVWLNRHNIGPRKSHSIHLCTF